MGGKKPVFTHILWCQMLLKQDSRIFNFYWLLVGRRATARRFRAEGSSHRQAESQLIRRMQVSRGRDPSQDSLSYVYRVLSKESKCHGSRWSIPHCHLPPWINELPSISPSATLLSGGKNGRVEFDVINHHNLLQFPKTNMTGWNYFAAPRQSFAEAIKCQYKSEIEIYLIWGNRAQYHFCILCLPRT